MEVRCRFRIEIEDIIEARTVLGLKGRNQTSPKLTARERALRIGRDALLLVLLITAVNWWQTRSLVATRERAPNLSSPLLSGGAASLAEAHGSVTVVYFFAPWCGVCRLSGGNLQTLVDWTGSLGIKAYPVALDYDSTADVERFVDDAGLEIPVLLGDEATREAWRIQAYPTYYVVAPDGTVAASSVGYSSLVGLLARAAVALLSSGRPSSS